MSKQTHAIIKSMTIDGHPLNLLNDFESLPADEAYVLEPVTITIPITNVRFKGRFWKTLLRKLKFGSRNKRRKAKKK